MNTKKVRFVNNKGLNLSGRLTLPFSGTVKAYALFAHCFTCNKNLNTIKYITQALTENGFGVLAFDFTGLGDSEGEFADSHFSANIADLVCAADYLRKDHRAPSLIIGHSLGGAAALFASAEIEEIKAVVTIGAPSEPEHVTHLFSEGLEELKNKGKAKVNIGGRDFNVTQDFVDQLKAKNMTDLLSGLRKAFLFMHSPQDDIVGISHAANLYSKAFHPKSFISLDGATHLLAKEKDAKYAGKVLADWAVRYLDLSEETNFPESGVNVKVFDGNFTSEVLTKEGHKFIADEPTSVGGNNLGPTPYDLLAAGLGACTGMTLRMYAQRKKWDIGIVDTQVTHEKIHAEDCDECEDKNEKIDQFYRKISISGDITNEMKAKLLEIADKCPVHKTLENKIIIKTEIQ
ncbi:MAG: putative OsmC-like protein/esterase/lipase [Sphingobacteriales bacterium]|jgi:uncharacterized OsmC-like protein/esterase/lipase